MKIFLLAVAIFGIINARSIKKKGLSKDDEWFDGLSEVGTAVIVDTFGLGEVKDLVKQNVEDCMQQEDVTDCLVGKVDSISDALGDEVSKAERDDAKVKVGALADFLAAVYGACKGKADEELGKCAYEEGKKFCAGSEFGEKKCMGGVKYVLGKAKKVAEAADKSKKRGLSKDDEWFEGLAALGTEVIVDHFDLEGVRDLVKQNVEDCMQKDDVTDCLVGKVDSVSDALGDEVPKAERDDAKVKVGALADFLGAVYGSCKGKADEELGKCAFEEGKKFCAGSEFGEKECMGGVMYVLGKAKELYDKQ